MWLIVFLVALYVSYVIIIALYVSDVIIIAVEFLIYLEASLIV